MCFCNIITRYADGQLLELIVSPVASSCDEFAHRMLQLVYAAVLHQFRLDRTHGTLPPPPCSRSL